MMSEVHFARKVCCLV